MNISGLKSYAEELKKKFALHGNAFGEDQLKFGVVELLKAAGAERGRSVDALTEVFLPEQGVRPDIAIYVDGLRCGYVELKKFGSGADAPNLQGQHNKEQWKKLSRLPNLIYTDGREWALYRSGERPGGQDIVRLHGDPTKEGEFAADEQDVEALGKLFLDFLEMEPAVPHEPGQLAEYLAPLTRLLRSDVERALAKPESAISLLAKEWRRYFFPQANNAQFADAYAQTVTYAMFMARLSGAEDLNPGKAAKVLDRNNGLLAETLKLLGHDHAQQELEVGFRLLRRSLEALKPDDFLKSKPDLWLYFYEHFLAAYDPELRKKYGVYYTPREVVELQVRLAAALLKKEFGKNLGFADDGVMFIDPAVGTGTYLVAAVKQGLEKVRSRHSDKGVPAAARQIARNMYGFEILVGPYAVAHLRLTQALEGAMGKRKGKGGLRERLKIYLADTLESPNASPPGGLTLTHRALTREHEAARDVKNEGDVLVCLGNPPYRRHGAGERDLVDGTRRREGGWVRFGDQEEGGAKQEEQGERAIFEDFLEPARKAGAGRHLRNLYNDYVYFWRWALWRLFEKQDCGGIVTFITASSYLTGPGFVGVREAMRRAFDELWIIDLGGDARSARKTSNVFNIRTPVAIAIGVRRPEPSPDAPADVHYVKIEATTREGKLAQLEGIADIDCIAWHDCPRDWRKPFYPADEGGYFEWPSVPDLFPWQHSGCQHQRSWPIGETRDLLEKRWARLVAAEAREKDELIRSTSGRHKDKAVDALLSKGKKKLKPIGELKPGDKPEGIVDYSFRAYDRRFLILDGRVGDRFRPRLVRVASNRQVFFVTLQIHSLGHGQGMIACAHLPDRHVLCGRGGKDVIPLYRDAEGTEPNVTHGLLDALGKQYGAAPTAEEFASYVYAVLGGQSYTRRFSNELETPGPHIPITKDAATFADAAKLGRKLIWLHTYAERFQGGDQGNEVCQGKAMMRDDVHSNSANYPAEYGYSESEQEIRIGEGRFGPVEREVWDFEISGLKVVQSWLGYRMRERRGRKSSPLDEMRPEQWTPAMSNAFLELLWVLEATLKMEPELEAMLGKIVAGSCFSSDELPQPSEEQRKPPALEREADYEQTVMSSIVNGQGGGEPK